MERSTTQTEPAAAGNGDAKEQAQEKAKEVAGKAQEQIGEARDAGPRAPARPGRPALDGGRRADQLGRE